MSRRVTTERIVVHAAYTDPNWHGSISVDDIDRWHREERGWAGIGYHLYVPRNGVLQIGRDFGAVGAHARGYNNDSFAICLEGGAKAILDDDRQFLRLEPVNNFTEKQFIALQAAVAMGVVKYGIDPDDPDAIVGHRDLPGVTKACPCFDVREWWALNRPTELIDPENL